MLENMFIGRPAGNYDRLLDFSRAVTGNLFFVPTATFLDNVDAGPQGLRRIPRLRQMPNPHHLLHGRRMVRWVSVHSKERFNDE